ncbi:hypothetical protein TUBRATIS_17600 [Tubulinosema ratisbonensis]|uniref:Uncharacterized protein n=1 Tax=Tubulinosema ratisbonensis TaxID=291195 RepID=A0A437AL12_9MICR|nr:hypothetical protein TUBRATIS_17600 [Tubulinosema ratisbonensis]
MLYYFMIFRFAELDDVIQTPWYGKLRAYSIEMASDNPADKKKFRTKALKFKTAIDNECTIIRDSQFVDFKNIFKDPRKEKEIVKKIFDEISRAIKDRFREENPITHMVFLARLKEVFEILEKRESRAGITAKIYDSLNKIRNSGEGNDKTNSVCIII